MSQVATPPPAPRPRPTGRRPGELRLPRHTDAQLAPVVVGQGASFEGWLTCRGAARIDGRFVGNVIAAGRIEIGETAEVTGRIEARDIVVAGSFDGELVAIQCIELLATARVTGELHARALSAEEGCMVTGLCRTGSTPKPSA